MDKRITEHDILEQEAKLYQAIKESKVTLLDELLHNSYLIKIMLITKTV